MSMHSRKCIFRLIICTWKLVCHGVDGSFDGKVCRMEPTSDIIVMRYCNTWYLALSCYDTSWPVDWIRCYYAAVIMLPSYCQWYCDCLCTGQCLRV